MNVGQVMTRNPRTCSMDDTMDAAARIMWENDCGCVPVVDKDGRTTAMITDRDICMAGYTQGRPLWQMRISSAASRELIAVREDDPVEMAERLMQRHQLRRLPVVDSNRRITGIVSLNDLARRGSSSAWRGELNSDAIARTLAAVCAPTPRSMAAE